MNSQFAAALERLARTPATRRNFAGSPIEIVVACERADWPGLRSIDAMQALFRRGLPLMSAKLTIEAMIEHGRVYVEVPFVDDPAALFADLAQAGVTAQMVDDVADPALLAAARAAVPTF